MQSQRCTLHTCGDRQNNPKCGKARNSSTGSHATNSKLVLQKRVADLLFKNLRQTWHTNACIYIIFTHTQHNMRTHIAIYKCACVMVVASRRLGESSKLIATFLQRLCELQFCFILSCGTAFCHANPVQVVNRHGGFTLGVGWNFTTSSEEEEESK